MTAAKERLVHAHCDGVDYTFVRANRLTSICFGGPLEREVTGLEHGPRRLHAIGCLSARVIPALSRPYISSFPLIYGMCFDGCEMIYRLVPNGPVEVVHMSTTRSLNEWPYRDFPALLPFVPLALATATPRSYADFAKRFPNMPDRPEGQLVVCVPPPATVGVSLWGSGDYEGVTIVFDCDLTTATVQAYNVTTRKKSPATLRRRFRRFRASIGLARSPPPAWERAGARDGGFDGLGRTADEPPTRPSAALGPPSPLQAGGGDRWASARRLNRLAAVAEGGPQISTVSSDAGASPAPLTEDAICEKIGKDTLHGIKNTVRTVPSPELVDGTNKR